MIPVCRPYVGVEEEAAVVRVLRSGRLVQGPEIEKFEQAVAEYVGVKHAVATSSGTTALHTALLAMGVKHGDKVLVPAFTFVATANAVLACGATPILCDIDPINFCVDWSDAVGQPLKQAKVALPVCPFGYYDWKTTFFEMFPVLVDAACAFGSFRLVETVTAAIFSFHATKIITTGEGGMIVTNDDALAERCRFLRDQKHGQGMAYNYRMTEIAGAIGRQQVKKLPWILARRAEIAAVYDAEFGGTIRARIPPRGGNYQSYVLLLNEDLARRLAINALALLGVEALPATQFLGDMPHLHTEGLPNARFAGLHAMRIPIYPQMTDEEVETVVQAVKGVLG